jgi:hypothetical protein
MAFAFPSSPTIGQGYQGYVWDGQAWQVQGSTTAPAVAHGQCKLVKTGANLVLMPVNGNRLTVNGVTCTIPAAGVSLAPTGLAVGTLYYVYAVATAGVITSLEASTTAHATSATAGNIGLEIKSGDDTRTLVGMARVITGPAWQDTLAQRYVRSWFNDRGIETSVAFTTSRTVTVTAAAEVHTEIRNELLLWAGETLSMFLAGAGNNSSLGPANWVGIAIDSTTVIEPGGTYFNSAVAAYAQSLSATNHRTGLAEGYHFITLLAWVSSGSFAFSAGGGSVVFTTLSSLTRGH